MNFWSTQNVNVARFARNVEWDFFYDFQTLCLCCFKVPMQIRINVSEMTKELQPHLRL